MQAAGGMDKYCLIRHELMMISGTVVFMRPEGRREVMQNFRRYSDQFDGRVTRIINRNDLGHQPSGSSQSESGCLCARRKFVSSVKRAIVPIELEIISSKCSLPWGYASLPESSLPASCPLHRLHPFLWTWAHHILWFVAVSICRYRLKAGLGRRNLFRQSRDQWRLLKPGEPHELFVWFNTKFVA